MIGKIGLEEHFAIEETIEDSNGFLAPDVWPELRARLLDIQDIRLRQMDAQGMEMMLLSLNAPAVQALPDSRMAIDVAMRANDYLAGEVAKRPDRFQVGQKFDAMVAGFDRSKKPNFSIKARQLAEEKEAVEQYGSSDSGASLGDILGAALKANQ